MIQSRMYWHLVRLELTSNGLLANSPREAPNLV